MPPSPTEPDADAFALDTVAAQDVTPQAPQPPSGEASDAGARRSETDDVAEAARDRADDEDISADDAGATALAATLGKR